MKSLRLTMHIRPSFKIRAVQLITVLKIMQHQLTSKNKWIFFSLITFSFIDAVLPDYCGKLMLRSIILNPIQDNYTRMGWEILCKCPGEQITLASLCRRGQNWKCINQGELLLLPVLLGWNFLFIKNVFISLYQPKLFAHY